MGAVAMLGRLAKRGAATATLWRLRARPLPTVVQLGSPAARAVLVPTAVLAVQRQTHTHGRGHDGASPAAASAACWKCHAPLAAGSRLVCRACGVGQPVPAGTTYFDIFGLPPRFDINLGALKRAFLGLQQSLHPDRFTLQDAELSDQLSSLVNKAHNTLRDPLARAQYLLSLKGIHTAEGANDGGRDADLLMTILEEREQLEEARTHADVDELRRRNDERIHRTVAEIDHAFKHSDLAAAQRAVARLQYWTSLQSAIREWEPGKAVVLKH